MTNRNEIKEKIKAQQLQVEIKEIARDIFTTIEAGSPVYGLALTERLHIKMNELAEIPAYIREDD